VKISEDNRGNFVLEDCERLYYRNFQGRVEKYNETGKKSFTVRFTDEEAALMLANKWNVKSKPAREEGEAAWHTMHVAVNFESKNPPRIIMLTSKGRTQLDEQLCGLLDFADIKYADMIIHPHDWTVNGNTGRKAYLQSIYVWINEDVLELKYQDVPEIGAGEQQERLAIPAEPYLEIVDGEVEF